jgi:Phage P2 GpE
MIADLAHFFHWSPRDAWDQTGSELVWWAEQSLRIAARAAPPPPD